MVRDAVMDQYCESLAEIRASQKADRKAAIEIHEGALVRAIARNHKIYRHATIEFSYVPGGPAIKSRITKDESDASSEGADIDASAGEDNE